MLVPCKWFVKESLFVEWFPILIIFIGILYPVWVVLKAITDFFKVRCEMSLLNYVPSPERLFK
jgi:hypothetical protein